MLQRSCHFYSVHLTMQQCFAVFMKRRMKSKTSKISLLRKTCYYGYLQDLNGAQVQSRTMCSKNGYDSLASWLLEKNSINFLIGYDFPPAEGMQKDTEAVD